MPDEQQGAALTKQWLQSSRGADKKTRTIRARLSQVAKSISELGDNSPDYTKKVLEAFDHTCKVLRESDLYDTQRIPLACIDNDEEHALLARKGPAYSSRPNKRRRYRGKFGKMSNIIALDNMLASITDLDAEIDSGDLKQDIGQECGEKYGTIEKISIDTAERRVFIKFTNQVSALRVSSFIFIPSHSVYFSVG